MIFSIYMIVESVAQVVGRRTQDHKVVSLCPDSGLNSEIAVKLWNRVPHELPMTQRQWGAERKLWPYGTCVLVTTTGTAIMQKAQYVRVGPFPMISGVIVKSGETFRLDPDYKPAPLPFTFTKNSISLIWHFCLVLLENVTYVRRQS